MKKMIVLSLCLLLGASMSAGQDKKEEMTVPDLKAKDWKKMDNGMRTWDFKVGTGDEVKAGDKVTIHYTGWLTNGKMFDSSKTGGGKPITFPLKSLIKGWQVGVPGMKKGGIRRLEIPYNLAYGEAGTPDGTIPPKATLVFEIELIGIVK